MAATKRAKKSAAKRRPRTSRPRTAAARSEPELRALFEKKIRAKLNGRMDPMLSLRALEIARKYLADEAKARKKAEEAAGFTVPAQLPFGYVPGAASSEADP